MTLIFGIFLYISDKFDLNKNIDNDFSFKSAMIIGIFQTIALVPGVSRSGITISAARVLNFKRYDAAKISFLLSIPTLGAVSVFGVKNIISPTTRFFNAKYYCDYLFILFSLITIKYFLKYIKISV